ncbi:MAG: hypothetical protein JNK49_15320 [Planctomycetes bacterium]|nr:hypothetical protein [Planctomycetota bacterium]
MNTLPLPIPRLPACHLLRRASYLLPLLLGTLLPAQKFQYGYGSAGVAESGNALAFRPGGHVIVGTVGTNPLGIATDVNGTQLFGATHTPLVGLLEITPHCLRQLADGGYLVAGEVDNGLAGLQVFLTRFSAAGVQWPFAYRIYSGEATGFAQGVRAIQSADGGFAVITNVDTQAASRGVLFTTDGAGVLSCWKSYTYNNNPVRFHDLCQASDGSFVIVGSMQAPGTQWRETLILRTTCAGIPMWAFTYAGGPVTGQDVAQHAIAATANGFAVYGHFGPTSSLTGSFLMEVDLTGASLWRRHYATLLGSRPTLALAEQGRLLMNGQFGDDAVILRTDATGAVVTATRYGALGKMERLFQVLPTADGGAIATGTTEITNAAQDVYLVRANAAGDSDCNWASVQLPQTLLQTFDTWRQLQSTDGGTQFYYRMNPPQPAAPPHPICVTPGPLVYTGHGSSTTVGTPWLSADTPPVRGHLLHLDTSLLRPNGFAVIGIALGLSPFPLPLMLYGGQPDSFLYCDPGTLVTVGMLTDALGQARYSMPIPNHPVLLGASLGSQVFDFDPALPFALPLGNSRALSLTIQ